MSLLDVERPVYDSLMADLDTLVQGMKDAIEEEELKLHKVELLVKALGEHRLNEDEKRKWQLHHPSTIKGFKNKLIDLQARQQALRQYAES